MIVGYVTGELRGALDGISMAEMAQPKSCL
jgi:hypothetical protein